MEDFEYFHVELHPLIIGTRTEEACYWSSKMNNRKVTYLRRSIES